MDMTEKPSAMHSLEERKFATHLEVIAPNGISRIFLPLCFIFFIMKRFPSQPFGVVFSKIQNVATWSHKAQNECEKSFHFKWFQWECLSAADNAHVNANLFSSHKIIPWQANISHSKYLLFWKERVTLFSSSHLVLLKLLNCQVFSIWFLNEEKQKLLTIKRERRSRFTHGTL